MGPPLEVRRAAPPDVRRLGFRPRPDVRRPLWWCRAPWVRPWPVRQFSRWRLWPQGAVRPPRPPRARRVRPSQRELWPPSQPRPVWPDLPRPWWPFIQWQPGRWPKRPWPVPAIRPRPLRWPAIRFSHWRPLRLAVEGVGPGPAPVQCQPPGCSQPPLRLSHGQAVRQGRPSRRRRPGLAPLDQPGHTYPASPARRRAAAGVVAADAIRRLAGQAPRWRADRAEDPPCRAALRLPARDDPPGARPGPAPLEQPQARPWPVAPGGPGQEHLGQDPAPVPAADSARRRQPAGPHTNRGRRRGRQRCPTVPASGHPRACRTSTAAGRRHPDQPQARRTSTNRR